MRRLTVNILVLAALLLSACAQVQPPQTAQPVPGEPQSTEAPAPLPAETQPIFEPANPDSTIVSPVKPGAETPAANPWDPQPGDKSLERGGVFINGMSLVVMESYPPQYMLGIEGDLPTPCNQLRVRVGEPDAKGQIAVEAYTVIDNSMACIQVLSPFTVNIPLGSYTDVTYTVLVNGEKVGEIGE